MTTIPRHPDSAHAEHNIQLSDGRTIGVAEFGVTTGRPIFWFHGTPGARRQVPPRARDLALHHNVRLMGVERPGIGSSTRHRYDGFSDFASDIAEIADQLAIERFSILGLSGGGPYTLACAHRLRERVIAAAIFGGVAPATGTDAATGGAVRITVPLQRLLHRFADPLGDGLSWLVRSLHPYKDAAFPVLLQLFLSENDRAVLLEPRMRTVFIDDILEGSRTGMHTLLYDLLLFGRAWDFSPREIGVPVHFFQGDADALVPLEHGQHLAALVPGASFTHVRGAGHMGTLEATEAAFEFVLAHIDAAQKPPRRRRLSAVR